MTCRIRTTLAMALLAFAARPALAQDSTPAPHAAKEKSDDAAVMASLTSMFAVEPLTAEQQERLPLARQVVDKMMPPGTYGEMMGSMFDKIIGPMRRNLDGASSSEVAKQLGVESNAIALDSDQAGEVATLLDPAWRERRKARMAAVEGGLNKMMAAMEPSIRDALTEAYAVHFDRKELTDIDAFFSTESGAAFARRSFTMASDPRFVGATMKALPHAFGALGEIESAARAATADLPPLRSWSDLSPAEQARLAKLTGLAPAALKQGMAKAADEREASENPVEQTNARDAEISN